MVSGGKVAHAGAYQLVEAGAAPGALWRVLTPCAQWDFIGGVNKCVLVLVAVLAFVVAPSRVHAVYTLTLRQVGNDVVLSGSGTLNLTALAFVQTNVANVGVYSDGAYVAVGSDSANTADSYSGLTGPADFGSSQSFFRGFGSGTITGVYGRFGLLYVPANYVSGSALSSTCTLYGYTIAQIGFTPGTNTYTWGIGAATDSFIITSVVPEPSTWALLGLGTVGAGAVALRRRQAIRG